MSENTNGIIRQLNSGEEIPYHLLLLADETIEAIDKYISTSEIYLLEQDDKMIAVYALWPLSKQQIEIKNIAVHEDYQGRGIGRFLLKDAENKAKERGYREIIIGTPDSAIKQLSIYKKAGFEEFSIKKDFFTLNYPQPIFEEGIQLKDMVMLRKKLIS